MVNRGYSSASAMYESARRFLREGRDKRSILFYLGDHDPSGEDMVRDVQERLATFGADVDVQKIALTMEQVKRYRPPPNVLAEIVRDAIGEVVDREKMGAIIEREEEGKKKLRKAAEKIG